jgi:hypothetical protein
LFVSGKNRAVMTTAIKVITPAITNGTEEPNPTVNAAIAGPKIKPKLNAALIIPKALGLSSGFVESEITAKATGMFPAVIPSSMRAINRKIKFGANAIRKKEIAVPIIDINSKGFLPYLSDIRPIIGVEINWQIENEAKRSPFWKSESPNFFE